MGCPCDQYECNLPEKKAILVLGNIGGPVNEIHTDPPVLIQPGGENFSLRIHTAYENFNENQTFFENLFLASEWQY